jgi:hypothetical protein
VLGQCVELRPGEGYRRVEARSFRRLRDADRVAIRSTRGGRSEDEGLRSHGEDLEKIDVAFVGEAEEQVDMAAVVPTDRAAIEALHEAAACGVRVRNSRDANMVS